MTSVEGNTKPTAYYEDDAITLLHGDALKLAKTLEPKSVRTIITSPPYFGLRDYGESAQLGSEKTVAEFVANLVGLFRSLRASLTDDGSLWLNLGDSYSGARGGAQGVTGAMATRAVSKERPLVATRQPEMPAKNLIGVPWRTAFALQDDGWILRSEIIWAKPNPMPESVIDRPTKAHETLFLFSKSPRYYYDAEAIAEPVTVSTMERLAQTGIDSQEGSARANGGRKTNGNMKAVGPRFGGNKFGNDQTPQTRTYSGEVYEATERRNKRTVWTVPTQPFSGAHFAVYPPELIRPCIRAGSEAGDTVLDPFSGSGTTGMVATQEGRKYIGMDLNSDYLDLSLRTRFAQPPLNLAVSS